MKRIFGIITALLLCNITGLGQPDSTQSATAPRISLITCHAGSVMYELCGHTAIRIQLADEDIAVNYGLFEFQTENFALKFLKGETDYRVGAYPFNIFMRHYLSENRRVVEQQLNLTPQQAWRMYYLLEENLRPGNCVYRYNYVKNNCATKPIDIIEQAVGSEITFTEPLIDGASTWSYRDEMRHFHQNYPWYQLGIDMALGSGIDYQLATREKMFAPMALESMMRGATVIDSIGNKINIVAKETTINPGTPAQLPPTPFVLSPNFIFLLLFGMALFISAQDIKRKRITHWFDSAIYGSYGFVSLLLCFLIFVSVNEATSPNYLILLLNPLCFIPAICAWSKKCSAIVLSYHMINIVALILLSVILLTHIQSGNPAITFLIGTSLLRSAVNLQISRCNAKKTK